MGDGTDEAIGGGSRGGGDLQADRRHQLEAAAGSTGRGDGKSPGFFLDLPGGEGGRRLRAQARRCTLPSRFTLFAIATIPPRQNEAENDWPRLARRCRGLS
jgi:hypothetical protein